MDDSLHLEELAIQGFTVLHDVLQEDVLEETRRRMDALYEQDVRHFGEAVLRQMRELGTLRFMLAADRFFLQLIAVPRVLGIIEQLLGNACILHLQNGIVLTPEDAHQQSAFHQDYRRWMNGYTVSYSAFFLIDEFTPENGGTWVVPATHVLEQRPSDTYLQEHAIQTVAPAGCVLLFNSRLWHWGGENRSQRRRRAVNTQYTYSYIRSQVDYAHCLPEDEYAGLPERLQQLLGRLVRLPRTIDEFRVPAEQRLYRAGQG